MDHVLNTVIVVVWSKTYRILSVCLTVRHADITQSDVRTVLTSLSDHSSDITLTLLTIM